MQLNDIGLKDKNWWEKHGYQVPKYDRASLREQTLQEPTWIHFGAGNIFRAFLANVAEGLLNRGEMNRGIIVAEGFDYEILEKSYQPQDNYSILATLKANGMVDKTVIGSVVESVALDFENEAELRKMKEIFSKKSLQMASFTITEKGYRIADEYGNRFQSIALDFGKGPKSPESYLGKVVSLLVTRYENGGYPIAMVSMDNCSHNGEKLEAAVSAFAKEWIDRGFVDIGFESYIKEKVTFPWSMIDKITPRPDQGVYRMLLSDGLENMEPVVTAKNTYVAPFVNAEECEYLVIEDDFPNGRPALEKGGVIFTDRRTVEKVEKMKVCTCLNPLHTTLAIFGCLLGYHKLSEEMKDKELRYLVETLGYEEGLPVVEHPEIMDPKEFLETVLTTRIPNPFMPDTPQRIATDTSQKLAIRFGETLCRYLKQGRNLTELSIIPLVFAGWLRYLVGVDDFGNQLELSPDPMLKELRTIMEGIEIGTSSKEQFRNAAEVILSKTEIFGIDLRKAGLMDRVCDLFVQMMEKPGAVRNVLKKTKPVVEQIGDMGIVPVVVLNHLEDALPLAKELCEAGLGCAEVTFRTEVAEEALRIMAENYPDMLLGAGTVLTTQQVDRAVAAGAQFIVSPGTNPSVVKYCIKKNIPIIPGTASPSEVEQAISLGLDTVKFFPAEPLGGMRMIKALAAPYTGVRFMPTGGIQVDNVREYLECDQILACGGSWMVSSKLMEAGNFAEIGRLAREAVEIVKQVRG